MINYAEEWGWWEDYILASAANKRLLEILDGKLFKVQYAPKGQRAKYRREIALEIVNGIEEAYKLNRKRG